MLGLFFALLFVTGLLGVLGVIELLLATPAIFVVALICVAVALIKRRR
jgi:hypothetical protein